MAVSSTEEFFAILEKSRLLEAGQLADARTAASNSDGARSAAKLLIRKHLITEWQAGQLLAGRSAFFLGKYKLIELLGRGGMGGVFLAEHVTMNRRVALKIISRQIRKDPALLERFLSEARTIAMLDHPNIVRAYGVDNEADRYYIIMEFIDGVDLKQMVEDGGPMDFEKAADYIRQAADGLAHAHDQNMIHCDIKPSNLLVSNQGVLKILDMGLSRLTDQGKDVDDSDEQRVLGSVDYLAPEQAVESPDFDYRADIYSLGCTSYYLLTGHPPFPEGTLAERILKHQNEEPEDLVKQRPDVPAELADICRKMMAKNPDDRPQSAEQVSLALAAWQPPTRRAKRALPPKVKPPIAEEGIGNGLPKIDIGLGARPAAESAAAPAVGPPVVNIDTGPEPAKSGPAAPLPGIENNSGRFSPNTARKKAGSKKIWLIAGGRVVLLLAVGVVAGVVISQSMFSGLSTDDSQATTEGQDNNDGEAGRAVKEPNFAEPSLDSDPSTKQPAEEQPAEEQPTEEQPAEEQPAEEQPVEEQPVEEPPVEKPPVEPPPVEKDPLRALAGAVDMTPLDDQSADGEVSLGKLFVEDNTLWDLKLVGGESALKGRRKFTLQAVGMSIGTTDWMIRAVTELPSSAKPEQVDVAKIHLNEDHTLKLTWVEGEGRQSAGYLRNCALTVTQDGKTRWINFGTPMSVAAPVVNLDVGTSRVTLPAKWLSDAEKLQMEITSLQGLFDEPKYDPANSTTPGKPIAITRTGTATDIFGLQVTLNVKVRSARVDVSAFYRLGNEWVPFKAKNLQQLTGKFQAGKQYWVNQKSSMPEKIEKRKELIKQIDQKLAIIDNNLAKLAELSTLYESIKGKGKVHFRVFTTIEDRQINLFETSAETGDDTAPETSDES